MLIGIDEWSVNCIWMNVRNLKYNSMKECYKSMDECQLWINGWMLVIYGWMLPVHDKCKESMDEY